MLILRKPVWLPNHLPADVSYCNGHVDATIYLRLKIMLIRGLHYFTYKEKLSMWFGINIVYRKISYYARFEISNSKDNSCKIEHERFAINYIDYLENGIWSH